MTNQEAFNKIAAHLLKQDKRSILIEQESNIVCAYRSPDGLKCTIGCLIAGADYDAEI